MKYYRALGTLAILALVLTCAGPMLPESVREAPDSSYRIAVIKSSKNPLYNRPVKGFIRTVRGHVDVYKMDDSVMGASSLAKALAAKKPDLVYTLGSRATLFAKKNLADTPIVFSMVMSHQRYGLEGIENVAGIAFQIRPRIEFLKFKMTAPDLKKIVAFYVPEETQPLVDKATQDLKSLGMELNAVAVASHNEVVRAYDDAVKGADAVWLLNDPVVVSPRTFEFLREESYKGGIALLTSMSHQFAEAGALMSVSIDFTSLGPQAGVIARRILEQSVPVSEIGLQYPIGGILAVNLSVAKQIKHEIPTLARPFINRLYSDSRQQKDP